MKVRNKLIMLAVGAMFLPTFLTGGYFFLLSSIDRSMPRPDTEKYYANLDKHRSSLEEFLEAARGEGPATLAIGGDGAVLFSKGSSEDLAAILYAIGKGVERKAAAEDRQDHSLVTRTFDVAGYGPVRVLVEFKHPSRDVFLDLVFLVSFTLLLFIAGTGLAIAQSLQGSLNRIGKEASRLAGGDLDTPIGPGRGEDVALLAEALEELRQSLRREQARRARLIMGVSHDFRTPISLIKGYADALRDRVAKDSATEERYLGVIIDKTGQLEALVDDLLEYVRMESDQHREELPKADIGAFFKSLAAEFSEDAAMMERRFSFIAPGGEGIMVSIDMKAAGRAFRNLFANAVRYTAKGGEIRFELDYAEGAAGGVLLASLTDDGIGVAPEDRDSIFEPFFRGKNAAGRGGSGLGLAVVKNVIESHGWRIACVSAPDKGARFTVTIPIPEN
jgi:signal transduction histidine kinase